MGKQLTLKYRPNTFSQIIGNDDILPSIQSKTKEGSVKAYLLYGERGCGKTTLARIIAKKLRAKSRNIHELDLSDVGVKDKARQLKSESYLAPFGGGAKVYILDEMQDSSAGFQAGVLKIMEEPPERTYFIICTTEPKKLKPAIKSRCAQFQVIPPPPVIINKHLKYIVEKEKKEVSSRVLREISKKTETPREALMLLDNCIDLCENDAIKIIKNYSIEENKEVIELCRLIASGESFTKAAKVLKEIKDNPESVRRAIINYLSIIRINSPNRTDIQDKMYPFMDSFFDNGKAGLIFACSEALGGK